VFSGTASGISWFFLYLLYNMDNFRIFITDSLEKFDKNNELYDNMFKNIYSVKYIMNESEIDYDQVLFYDKDGNKIIEANYEITGTYFVKKAVWIWPWSDATYNKKLITKSKNLLLYGLKLSSEQNFNLKLELINSRFLITDPIQIDIHLAIASELSKNPCIFKIAVPIRAEDIEESAENRDAIRMKIYKDKDIDDIEKFKLVYFFLFNIKETV
jgi:hypothetical protein